METSDNINTLKQALDMEKEIANVQSTLSALNSQHFTERPAEPTRKIIKREEPPVPKMKFHILINLILAIAPYLILLIVPIPSNVKISLGYTFLYLIAIIWFFVYLLVGRNAVKKQYEKFVRNSTSYKKQCEELERKYDAMQAQEDERYNASMKEYRENIIPQYESAFMKWNDDHKKEVSKSENYLSSLKDGLNHIYESTRIVPIQYRNPQALQFIYETVSTSDYSIKEAIDLYEKATQTRIAEEQRRQQEAYNQEMMNDAQSQYNDSGSTAGDFVRDAAKVATGAFVGSKAAQSGNRRNSNQTEKKARYMCPSSCPKRGKDYGPTRCRLDPATCGRGRKI